MKYIIQLVICFTFLFSNAQINSVELSHYVFQEFTPGYVLMDSGQKNAAMLNFNTLLEEMVFEDKGQKLAISDEQLIHVDTVFIKNRKFVYQEDKFLELLAHSDYDLYAEYKCNVGYPGRATGPGRTSQTSSSEHYGTLGTRGVFYELKLPDGYKIKPYNYYWLKKNGKLNKIKNLKQLQKLYDSQKEEFKKFSKQNDTKFSSPQNIAKLVAYMESN